MSLSVIWPTAACSTRTFTSSCASFSTVAWIASALPCTSALISTATSFCSPAWMRASIWSSVPRAPAVRAGRLLAQLAGAELGDLAGAAFVLHRDERLAGRRHAGQAEDLHRRRRPGLGDRARLVVQHRAHPAPLGAGHHDVALLQRALLHQHGRHRTAAAIQPAFDHRAFGRARRGSPSGRGFPPAARSPRSACPARSSWSRTLRRPASRRPSPRPRPRS